MAGSEKVGVEWVSISDLMSGVVGLMVVLFAVAAVRVTEAEREAREVKEKAERERAEAVERKQATISKAFFIIAADIEQQGLTEFIEVDVEAHRLKLRDATFRSGSACVDGRARAALVSAAPRLREVLQENPERVVFIEGHTDSNPVLNSTSSRESACARFDDNYTLSTARAREARSVVVNGWSEDLRNRVGLAGFGDSRPILEADRKSRIQRRVEISVRDAERKAD